MSVRSYLVNLKHKIDSRALKVPYTIVTGNQSADMDSIISAISFAYFNNLKSQEFIIPLINVPRADFKLRKDVVLLLGNHEVSEDLLYFVEDFEKWLSSSDVINVNLVDHNGLQGTEINNAFDEKKIKVVGIIDHHADENQFLSSHPRIIRSCGSNSSLVFNYFYNEIFNKDDKLFVENKDVIELLLGPLLIDTSNMTQKVEEPDIEALNIYKKILSTQELSTVTIDNYTPFYSSLKFAKKDLSGFSLNDILRKDYKQFKFSTGENVGFSSIGKSIKWIMTNYENEDIANTLSNALKINNIEMLIITSSYTQKENGVYTREFCYYYENKDNVKFNNLDKLSKAPLELNDDIYGSKKIEPTIEYLQSESKGIFKLYNQANIKASRKQVVPIIKDILENYN
ncbi:unnamed protein product [Candida verbasci]|uniref:DHHA2 domain-containing protein n=1 Tax=Candida verbasci TaxID=1227364 RepID=A0A9W4XCZ3_9ASCO|nr:unnamed protein product [Candida verbasci]